MLFNRFNLFHLFFFGVFIFAFASCNYNYYLGKQYEAQERYEQANLEYHQAFVSDSDDEDFKEAYERTSLLTAKDMEERYRRYIPENLTLQAYYLMNRALILEPDNAFFNEEIKKWKKVLLIGKVELEFNRLYERLNIASQMEFTVRLNTPNQDRLIYAEINLENNLFFAEDYIYDANENFLMLYSINSVGIALKSSLITNLPVGRINAFDSFEIFVNYGVPVLSKVTGSLDKTPHPRTSIFDVNLKVPTKTQTEDYKIPPDSVIYSVEFSADTIKVNSDAESLDFLPQRLFFNDEENSSLIDFGLLELQFVEDKDLWAIRRNFDHDYLADYKQNIFLYPYFFQTNGNFPVEKL